MLTEPFWRLHVIKRFGDTFWKLGAKLVAPTGVRKDRGVAVYARICQQFSLSRET